jgi:hypothetical protein
MKPMIKTGIAHAVVSVGLQLVFAAYLYYVHGFSIEHGVLAGGIAACTGYVFREMAQHEYKGGGPTKVSGTYGLLNHWTLDSIIDVLFPIIATGGVWILVKLV